MPRQPLPRNLHKGPWLIGPGIVEQRLEHVAIIGRITTFWPDVVQQLGLLLGVMLGVNSEAAVALFATLRNARARREGLEAVAELNLDPEYHELFEAILTIVGAAEKERDHLAHGCYGMSEDIQDGIYG